MIGAPWPCIRFRLPRYDVHSSSVEVRAFSYLPLRSPTRIYYWVRYPLLTGPSHSTHIISPISSEDFDNVLLRLVAVGSPIWTIAMYSSRVVPPPTAFDETPLLTNGISMLASPVEESRGQMFYAHFTRAPCRLIGRDANVPYGVQPNILELCGFSPLRNFGTLIMLFSSLYWKWCAPRR